VLRIGLLLLQLLQETPAPAEDSQLWLLETHLGAQVLAEALPVQQRASRFLVPLGELCRLLDLAVEIDFRKAQASGFVLAEDRRFLFDFRSGMVTVGGTQKFISLYDIVQQPDEVYVTADAFGRMFPVALEIDLPRAALWIKALEPLPLEQRLARERRAAARRGSLQVSEELYPRSELPYQAWSVPFMDLRAVGTLSPPNGRTSRGTENHSALLTGDLLFMEATAQAAGGDSNPLQTRRLTLGRKDPEGHLLGPLGAREVAVGHIAYPGSDLVAHSKLGKGFLLSNEPLNRPTEYERHTFRGPLPVGWDVELYQDDALIEYQQSRADGLYEFEVPVLFNLNIFRLVFYGPEGQRREEIHTFNVDQAMTPPGQLRYRLAAAVPDNEGTRTSLGLEMGLARNLSAAVDGATVELPDGRHAYGKASLLGSWSRLFGSTSAVADERGGWGAVGALQLRLDSMGLTLKREYFDGFRSERLPENFGRTRHRTSLRMSGLVPLFLRLRLPIVLEGERADLENGQSVRSLSAQLSGSYRGFALSNQVSWIEPPREMGPAHSIGSVRFGKSDVRYGVRSEASYELNPLVRVTQLALLADAPLAGAYLASIGVNRTTTSRQTRFFGSLHQIAGRVGFGVQASYMINQGASVTLTIFTGLQRDDQARQWHAAARPVSGSSAATARVFFDANDNGKLDPGERPLEGVGFTVNNGEHDVHTDGNGTAFLSNVPTHQETSVGLALASLDDPFWFSRRPGIRIVPRPGLVAAVDFPMVMAGEINGTVYLKQANGSREMSGIILQLCDLKGGVVKSARSAYDGFYELSTVPPGRYTLRLDPAQAARLGVTAQARLVELAPSGTILDGISVTLTRAPMDPNMASASAMDETPANQPASPAN
jgi:hypothetical protein